MIKELAIELAIVTMFIFLSACAVPDNNQIIESPDSRSIGVIGCSNTFQSVYGYRWSGGEQLWLVHRDSIHDMDGGSVMDWVNNDGPRRDFWKTFDNYLAKNPQTSKVWWQLCIPSDQSQVATEEAERVLDKLRERIPGVQIYVSPLSDFPDHPCEITGVEGIERSKSLAIELNERFDDVHLGPILGPLYAPEIGPEDHCHPNEEGMGKLGRQLKDFFDDGKRTDAFFIEEPKKVGSEEDAKDRDKDHVKSESDFESLWQERIDDALEQSDCPVITKTPHPQGYYQGPLTDTHVHIPAIPDWPSDEDLEFADHDARFGGIKAYLGLNIKMSEIACSLEYADTQKNFAFFPVYEDIPLVLLHIWKRTMETYPQRFTPFIMSSGNDDDPQGFPTVDAKTLSSMLDEYPGLFKGYGEIGLYARERGGSPALAPDSLRMMEIYPVIERHNLAVYIHLGEEHKDGFVRVLKAYPNITFIWHGDQLSIDEIEDILEAHPNAYYGIEAYQEGDYNIFQLFVGRDKQAYLDAMDEDFDAIVDAAAQKWKPFIERHPNQAFFGTDIGDTVWNYDRDAYLMMARFARAFIGRLDPGVQEKFAYKNAQEIFEN